MPRWTSCLIALTLLATASRASANFGPTSRTRPGQAAGEPLGLEKIALEHEELTLDLRPLEQGWPVIIEATYQLFNSGPEVTLDLTFLGGPAAEVQTYHELFNRAEVRLDQQFLPSRLEPMGRMPASWELPAHTPGLERAKRVDIPYSRVEQSWGLQFRATIPPGAHVLSVRYLQKATRREDVRDPVCIWQVAYVLAPARDWSRFGGLDVRVLLAPGWKAACDVRLSRVQDELRGTFSDLPADCLALTAQAGPWLPGLADTWSNGLGEVLGAAVVLLLTVISAWWIGRWLGRRQRTSMWALPLTLLAPVGWFWAGMFVLVLTARGTGFLLGGLQQISYLYDGYYLTLMTGLLVLVMAPGGFVTAQLVVFLAARRFRRLAKDNVYERPNVPIN